jgi:hypothetical protein
LQRLNKSEGLRQLEIIKNYFDDMDNTNTVVGQRIKAFSDVMARYEKTYKDLAQEAWGGNASVMAEEKLKSLHAFADETIGLVSTDFLKAMVDHTDDARAAEAYATKLFG